MRTTLDIDDDVLDAAKELARTQGKPAGKVISDLVRKSLTGSPEAMGDEPAGATLRDGWYVIPRRGGIVTSEMVAELLERADLDDAQSDD
ncbi:MAG TPA: CopG family transcriptional regulator [Bauldia sp.]|nr:CopG family transcriptional regulator [Bauldia sp.]